MVLATVYYVRREHWLYYLLAVLALVLAVSNHAWEAVVTLPAVVVLLSAQRLRDAIAMAATGLGSFVAVSAITQVQTDYSHAGLFSNYGFVNDPLLPLDPGWWFYSPLFPHPFSVADMMTRPFVVVGLAWCGCQWLRDRM